MFVLLEALFCRADGFICELQLFWESVTTGIQVQISSYDVNVGFTPPCLGCRPGHKVRLKNNNNKAKKKNMCVSGYPTYPIFSKRP